MREVAVAHKWSEHREQGAFRHLGRGTNLCQTQSIAGLGNLFEQRKQEKAQAFVESLKKKAKIEVLI